MAKHYSLMRICFMLFAFGLLGNAQAQCPTISCPANIAVAKDPNSCGAVVTFAAPVGTNPCATSTFNYTGSMQTFTVPANVDSLTITAKGGQGGNGPATGGTGAIITGTVAVTGGSTLKVLVGGKGGDYANYGPGGGGGSFITDNSNNPLIIAGGGGGCQGSMNGNQNASTTTTAKDGYSQAYPANYGIAGINGNGATNSPSYGPCAGNGGGLLSAGQSTGCGGTPGQSFVSGGAGGTGYGAGGFGGGGAGGNYGCGGGGGYNGGGGNYHEPGNGGGGGSYNAGTNQTNTVGNTGNGVVTITVPATTTLISGLPSGSTFPVGVTTEIYQVDDNLGNTTTCSFTITVTDTAHPQISCPGNVVSCTNVVNNIAPTTSNAACSDVTYTLTGATTGSGNDDASGTNFNTGVTTVKYKIANPNGNADSCTFTVTVNGTLTPGINITANPGNTVCAGTQVTFTAAVTNGGPTPTYQWQVNNVNAGSNQNTFVYTPNNNENITCILSSNAACANPTTATSNSISMTVNPAVVPTIAIAANPGNSVCAGSPVTFTATTTNAGPTPGYQWQVNNVNAGSNSSIFTYTPANNDVITCILTSNASCANPTTANSNAITMSVTPTVTPLVTISANPGTTVCSGTSVNYTASVTNGGPSPTYEWKVNNTIVSTSTTYTYTPANNDNVTCTITSNATCASPAIITSNVIIMTVNPNVTPTVSITVSPGTTVCAGTLVTFSATATNTGNAPVYQWKKNNVSVGGNSAVYTDNTFNNGDVITCTLTSNASCATPTIVTSNSITLTVNPVVVPSVTITANPGSTICPGTSVTFSATVTNGGPNTTYQWKKNNINTVTTATYTTASLVNNDYITCTITSNASCASPLTTTSNAIVITVLPTVTPAISIAVNTGDTICAGTLATFTATATNAGPAPVYQWKKNNVNVGNNTVSYALNSLNDGDVISCVLTSNATCASPLAATSNSITMTVDTNVLPAVNISANPGTSICTGTQVTFTAVPVNGGNNPVYQWTKNGNPVGNNATYTDNSLNDNDIITCALTSNANCATPATVVGNTLTMTVDPAVTPSLSITAYPGDTVCFGASVVFFATPVNGGNNPSYQWQKNGNPVGGNADMYVDNALNNGDNIMCILTSNANCASPATANSSMATIASGNSHILGGMTGITVTNHSMVNNPVDVRTTSCDLLASISPSGNSPVSGNTNVNVTIDLGVNVYNGQPYVQRHFDIEPDNNPGSATADITLYAYQDEFNAYNVIASQLGLPLLPNNGLDNGNVRITQFHGTGNTPGNYSGTYEYITPSVSWDAANHWWAMTFPVSGFSGFYIHTGNFPLQLKTIEQNDFSVVAYPNPVQDKLTIEVFGKRGNNSSITITDLVGRNIMQVPVTGDKVIADIKALAQGMYLLKYTDNKHKESIKITKQ